MTQRDEGRLSEWMKPDLDETALTRQWLNVRDRMETMRRRRFLALAAFGTLAVSAAATVFMITSDSGVVPSRPTAPVAVREDEDVVRTLRESTQGEPRDLRLADGSQIRLSPFSTLEGTTSRHSVSLSLERGIADFDVPHVEGRTFVVQAGDVSVRVVGTQFRVEREIARRNAAPVRVHVEHGRVEVRTPRESAFVSTGETWPPERITPASNRGDRAPQNTVVTPRPETPAPSETPTVTAESIFAEAAAARRAGRYDAAAALYSTLVERFPRDARAPLASYELGRMYLDAMRQPGRAIGALRRAIAGAPRSASYREDAMARLVSAYGRSGQTDGCIQARDRYLAEYPSGVHRTAVARSCTVE